MESLDNQIVVSIQCLTYNHAPYIRQCLDGFVMQKTNFRFEAIVHDDASTDGTQDIIREYEKRYPDIIKPIYQKENQYSKGIPGRITNIVNAHCKGKYIAICEGDDYWTDPYKLKKQVDYMEAFPKCSLIWAKAKLYNQAKEKYEGIAGRYMSGYYDMFVNYSIAPLTSMYRKSAVEGYAEFVKGQKWLLGDSPLYLYIAHDNDIHFMDEIVGVYRILNSSASHHNTFEKNVAFQNSTFDVVKFFCEKYGHPNFSLLEDIHYSRMFNYAFNNGKFEKARELFRKISNPKFKIRIKRLMLPVFCYFCKHKTNTIAHWC